MTHEQKLKYGGWIFILAESRWSCTVLRSRTSVATTTNYLNFMGCINPVWHFYTREVSVFRIFLGANNVVEQYNGVF